MRRTMGLVSGFVLGTIGALATLVAPARPHAGAAPSGRYGNLSGRSSRLAVAQGPRSAAGVEPRVRWLVAEQLGVGVDELAPEVSLTDDLAADSLDLAELVVVVEVEFD